jgi:hypothetical protein
MKSNESFDRVLIEKGRGMGAVEKNTMKSLHCMVSVGAFGLDRVLIVTHECVRVRGKNV